MYNRCLQAGKIISEFKPRKIANGSLMISFTLLSESSDKSKSIAIDVNAFGKCAEEIIKNYKLNDVIFIDGYLWVTLIMRRYGQDIYSFILTAQSIGGPEHIDLFEELCEEYEIKKLELNERLKQEELELSEAYAKNLVAIDEGLRKEKEILDESLKTKKSKK